MLIRAAIAVSASLALAACANDRPTTGELLPTSALAASVVPMNAPAKAAEPVEKMPKKTMADRVLTAIALERVTGMKPDPSRLVQ